MAAAVRVARAMRIKGAAVGVTLLMLAVPLLLPAIAEAQVGRLIGFLVQQSSKGHGHAKSHRHAKQAVHVILTSASGHKHEIGVAHPGRFSVRLPAGHYRICDTKSAGACSHPSCPVTLVGTRFGPTRQSLPVSTIVILPALKTHIQITCSG